MNNKKITAGLLALTFVFGGATVPDMAVNSSTVISASAERTEEFRYGDFYYTVLEDGTIGITRYMGRDTVVEIPEEINDEYVTAICDDAFHGRKIEKIIIPDGVEIIGEQAFADCNGLVDIDLPDSVTSIGVYAFFDCDNLENITLSNNLKTIGEGAFIDCEALKEIVIPDRVVSIGKAAFLGCSSLESITLSKKLKTVDERVFGFCSSLKSIVIPDKVTSLKSSAFEYCTELKSVVLSENLKSIESNVFYGCTSLKDITIPDKVTELGNGVFGNCTVLQGAVIPSSVVEIGSHVFDKYDYENDCYKPLPKLKITVHKKSEAMNYALDNGIKFRVTDAQGRGYYPSLLSMEYDLNSRRFRMFWTRVSDAEEYGVAVKLAGKWKVQAYTDSNEYVSPSMYRGQKYEIVICAKINGKWDTYDIDRRSFVLTAR